jgi:hypothetical protein
VVERVVFISANFLRNMVLSAKEHRRGKLLTFEVMFLSRFQSDSLLELRISRQRIYKTGNPLQSTYFQKVSFIVPVKLSYPVTGLGVL